MICERCKSAENVKTYKITKTNSVGEDVPDERTLCSDCADLTREAGYKLTGGKAPEAEPSAPEPEAAEAEPTPTDEPAPTRRGSRA